MVIGKYLVAIGFAALMAGGTIGPAAAQRYHHRPLPPSERGTLAPRAQMGYYDWSAGFAGPAWYGAYGAVGPVAGAFAAAPPMGGGCFVTTDSNRGYGYYGSCASARQDVGVAEQTGQAYTRLPAVPLNR